jgi:hypothetical protein
MPENRRNPEPPKFENPNYTNARGKVASDANKDKNEHENPDLNAGHVQESSRSSLRGEVGGWIVKVDRPLVVKPNEERSSDGPVIEPHGIRRV